MSENTEIPFSLSSNSWKNTNNIFVTGIDTGVGKTFVSKILCHYFQYDYWKPIQTGIEESASDSDMVKSFAKKCFCHKETYLYPQPVSPHWASKLQNETIGLSKILDDFHRISKLSNKLVVEGAGGIFTPLNENNLFMLNLIKELNIPVLIVSKNYLGSLNHTLLTAEVLKLHHIPILGLVLNNGYSKEYKKNLAEWTGIEIIMEIPPFN